MCPAGFISLLHSFINYNNVLVECLGFSIYKIKLCANMDDWISFPGQMPFICLAYLFAVTKTSNTRLSVCGKSRHPCLLSHLTGNDFSFFSFSMLWATGLPSIILIMLPLTFLNDSLLRKLIWSYENYMNSF